MDVCRIATQKEFDEINDNFEGRIYIKNNKEIITISRNLKYAVIFAISDSKVKLINDAEVCARENSTIYAYGNSRVVAWNAHVYNTCNIELHDDSIALNESDTINYELQGNAKVFDGFSNIEEYIEFYNIKEKDKDTLIMYKMVRMDRDGVLHSNYDHNFIYKIGEYATERVDMNTSIACSYGLHVSTKRWAIGFGCNRGLNVLLEVEVKKKDCVVYEFNDGKIRCSKLKVIREVPFLQWWD